MDFACNVRRLLEISIHALLAESDMFWDLIWLYSCLFLSTLSLRRATVACCIIGNRPNNFYPRSPCGERLLMGGINEFQHSISIHALLAESDNQEDLFQCQDTYFYPRSPCGERLQLVYGVAGCIIISIHALLAESDY